MNRALKVRSQVPMAVHYDDMNMDAGYRVDMVVEEAILVENKAVETLLPIYDIQIFTNSG
jgi:GxxExxY protein